MDKVMLARNIGNNIRCVREQYGLSINELAEKLGISTQYLGFIERGQRLFSLAKLIEFCEQFEISVDEVIYKNYIASNDCASIDKVKLLNYYLANISDSNFLIALEIIKLFSQGKQEEMKKNCLNNNS